MKKTVLFLISLLTAGIAIAQPSAVKKAGKSLITVSTFNAEGNLIGTAKGFFISPDGTAVAPLPIFNGAKTATIIDASGKTYNVNEISGVDDTYDIVKFSVDIKKATPTIVSADSATTGSQLWIVSQNGKAVKCDEATVSRVEKIPTSVYYTVTTKSSIDTEGTLLCDDNGQAVAILNAKGTQDGELYALGANFADSLRFNGLSFNQQSVKRIRLKKALPDDVNQAILMLFIGASAMEPQEYEDAVERFIVKFPQSTEGYVNKAQLLAGRKEYAAADEMIAKGLKACDKKDDIHYNYARMIVQKIAADTTDIYPSWTLDKAAAEAQEAYKADPVVTYKQLEAQIRFGQQRYDEALEIYNGLIEENPKSAEIIYAASRCHEAKGDTTAMMAMMDKAIETFEQPYPKTAAPYLLARAQARIGQKQFRQGVIDLNEYEKLVANALNDNFYYYRAQSELQCRMYQQALLDFKKCININPIPLYYAEEASLEVRAGLYDEAIITATELMTKEPQMSDGYLFLGLAQCMKGDKAEGRKNLEKALELGDQQAKGLIEKYATP